MGGDPDDWESAADEPIPFELEPDNPDAWVWSCDEPDDSVNPPMAIMETDF
jgi:hypothetical protein